MKSLNLQERQQLLVEAEFYALEGLIDLMKPKPVDFAPNAAFEGILNWLGCAEGTAPYQNPHDRGTVVATTSDGIDPKQFVSKTVVGSAWCNNAQNKYFQVDLKRSITITHYSLRYANSCHKAKNWTLQGSADGVTFALLDTHAPVSSFGSFAPATKAVFNVYGRIYKDSLFSRRFVYIHYLQP